MKKLLTTISALVLALTVKAQTASVMAIHNSADPALDSVDMYLLDGTTATLLEDNFAFRTSTGFVTAPAEKDIRIVFTPKNGTSIADSVIGFGFNLQNNGKYVLIAQGHFQSGFNPQKPFGLNVIANAENTVAGNGNKIAVYHGSTDAPSVDINAFLKQDFLNQSPLAAAASYGAITPYAQVPNEDYLINVSLPGEDEALLTYAAPLKTLGANGVPVIAFASGFLDPTQNLNGKPFGLFAALPDGSVIELPLQSTARLQLIHNSPDAAASSVDVYTDVSGTIQLLKGDFAYRTATPYLTVPANKDINVWIAPGNSNSYTDAVFETTIRLWGGTDALGVAMGVIDTSKFENGPDVGFDLIGIPAMSLALKSGETTLTILHGCTDAPAVDVRAGTATGALLAQNIQFGDFTAPVSIPATDAVVNVLPAGTSSVLKAYDAPLSAFKDSSIVVLASGFVTPSLPQGKDNGPAFGLLVITSSGRVIALSEKQQVSIEEIVGQNMTLFPNPAGAGEVKFNTTTPVQFEIYDSKGVLIVRDNAVSFDSNILAAGIYNILLSAPDRVFSYKFIKN